MASSAFLKLSFERPSKTLAGSAIPPNGSGGYGRRYAFPAPFCFQNDVGSPLVSLQDAHALYRTILGFEQPPKEGAREMERFAPAA